MSRPSRLSLDILHLKALIANDEFELRGVGAGPATRRSSTRRRELQSILASRRLQLALLQREQLGRKGYDPNQPRVPAGNPDGGQWTSTGAGGLRLAMAGGLSLGPLGNPFETVQPAAMSYQEKVRMFFGQRDLFGGGGSPGGPFLPRYVQGGPTAGVLQTPGRADIQLVSGTGGPASRMPADAPGFNMVRRTHVEGHAAARMRELGINRATLYINNPEICPGCMTYLSRMLPPGATLNVVLPNGTVVPFIGGVP
jgi:SCP1.201-like deaminase